MLKFFLNMNISTRLWLGFGALVLIIVVFGLSVLHQMNQVAKQGDTLFLHPFAVTRSVDEAELAILKIHREMKDIANLADQTDIHSHVSLITEYEEIALRHLGIVQSQFLGDQQVVENVLQSLADWRVMRDEVIQLRLEGDLAAAHAITRGKGAVHVAQIESQFETLNSFAKGVAESALIKARQIMRESTMLVGLVFVIAILLGTAIAVSIINSIRKPLTRLDLAAAKVSQGDLRQKIEVVSNDELGRLTSTFNFMVDSIRKQSKEIHQKNKENERLLLNILPGPIARRLKQGEKTISDYFPEVTVLFADIVGFTVLSDSIPPDEVVNLLNRLFTKFDKAAHKLGIEKIKTIGDCYMAAAGLSIEVDDPPAAMVKMAHKMLRVVDQVNAKEGTSLRIRIGINCGPVVAGVIGKSKFIYDLWGDTVNLASRMESHGIPDRIHVTEAVYERVKDNCALEARGIIEVRGKGKLSTYLIEIDDPEVESPS